VSGKNQSARIPSAAKISRNGAIASSDATSGTRIGAGSSVPRGHGEWPSTARWYPSDKPLEPRKRIAPRSSSVRTAEHSGPSSSWTASSATS